MFKEPAKITTAVTLRDVWLKYRLYFRRHHKASREDFWALKNINLSVEKGEAISIIGENGAGKTSILKIIAGMLQADKGIVSTNGTVSTLLEVGAGFHRDMTGRENIFFISSLFGLSKKQIEDRYEDIVAFADIGRFIDAPLKSYSQGMYMRLAFAVAIHVDPNILLVDDMFSVGDLRAQNKCIERLSELQEMGKTLIFVTHDLETAKRFCQRGIFLKAGEILKDGSLREVVYHYVASSGNKKGIASLEGERLGVVFNNGKLALSWDKEAITKERGGYVSIRCDGRTIDSLRADWEVKESGVNKMVLQGDLWDLPLSQTWTIGLDDVGNEIEIKIEIVPHQECSLEEYKLCFAFSEEYDYWFNPFDKAKFAAGDSIKDFSCFTDEGKVAGMSFVGLGCEGRAGERLPIVFLEDRVCMPDRSFLVQNIDNTVKARALQSKVNLPARINKALSENALLFHNKIKAVHNSTPQEFTHIIAAKSAGYLSIDDRQGLSLSVHLNSRVQILWKGVRITASKGFQTSFLYNDRMCSSNEAEWRIHKLDEKHLDILLQWPCVQVAQIWNIELLPGGEFSWKVYLELREDAVIRNNEFSVLFCADYEQWFTPGGSGNVSEELGAEACEDITMKNDASGIIGLKGIATTDIKLPLVLLSDETKRQRFNSVRKKIDADGGAMRSREAVAEVFFLERDRKDLIRYAKGSYLISDINLHIGDETRTMVSVSNGESCAEAGPAAGHQDCSLRVKRGSGALSSKGKELSKNFGMYTSLYAKEFHKSAKWYSSLDAIWETVDLKKQRILLKGSWPYLPIMQIWEIKLSANGFIWNVDMEAFAPVRIEKQQSMLMLQEVYNAWKASDEELSLFPGEFSLSGWDTLYRKKGTSRISVSADGSAFRYPGVSLLCFDGKGGSEAIVQNSNASFRSRVLGFENTIQANSIIEPGVYNYFKGAIELF